MTRRAIAFWTLFAVTTAIYGVMIAWSLPIVSAAAGDAAPFDLRPGGYSFAEAQVFLAALSPDGRAFYLNVQQRLDIVYPVLLSATLFFAIYLMAPARWRFWRLVLALVAVPAAVFDLLENLAVATMLGLGPDRITPEIVASASRWTVLKSWSTAGAAIVLMALLALWAGRKLRARTRRA